MKSSPRKRVLALLASATALAAATATMPSSPATARAASDPEVLARHLLAPLSLAVSKYDVSFVSQNFGGPVLRVEPGHRTREVTGGAGEVGGLSRRGRTLTYVLTGEGTPEKAVAFVMTYKDGHSMKLGNLGRAETNRNPDGDVEYGFTDLDPTCADQIDQETFGPPVHNGAIESHPYASAKIGGTTYVADAAANLVWEVSSDGNVKVLSILPPLPGEIDAGVAEEYGLPDCTIGETVLNEPVPTDVEVGPDGMLYVTTLAGEFPGAGAVFSIDPSDGTTEPVVGGLFAATGLAIAKNGDIYVAMLFPNTILRFPAGSDIPEEFATINQPAALEIANGHLYATTNVLAGLGFKQRQVPWAPRTLPHRDGPAGKLVRWTL
ncbi:ScyD/ScyE family protein [Nocardioides humilatus]|uniref:ScyD/ScyE family protein n=1 Tax=Nocardioides humilatus TaxID=2607660 RepID=A0A5B1LDN6_9ACTN|nr:ScyD/ScyE family protein [Nocardioides humilatus]KAA1417900.1 ScyD/ScyE family protein [Nocardioides humilatus]